MDHHPPLSCEYTGWHHMLSNSAEVESEVGMTEEEAKTTASYDASLRH